MARTHALGRHHAEHRYVDNSHPPRVGRPKNTTQTISLIVGSFLFVLGLGGILFSGVWGFHIGPLYGLFITAAGALLVWSGHLNKRRTAFRTCLGFGLVFGLHALAGFIFGTPGTPSVGFEGDEAYLLRIIPGWHEQGTSDHILNAVLSAFLLAGAYDWHRRIQARRKENDASA